MKNAMCMILVFVCFSTTAVFNAFAGYSGTITHENSVVYLPATVSEDCDLKWTVSYDDTKVNIGSVHLVVPADSPRPECLYGGASSPFGLKDQTIEIYAMQAGSYQVKVWGTLKSPHQSASFTISETTETSTFPNDTEPNDTYDHAVTTFYTTQGHLGYERPNLEVDYCSGIFDLTDCYTLFLPRGTIQVTFKWDEGLAPYRTYFYPPGATDPEHVCDQFIVNPTCANGTCEKKYGPYVIDQDGTWEMGINSNWYLGGWGGYQIAIDYTVFNKDDYPPIVNDIFYDILDRFSPRDSHKFEIVFSEDVKLNRDDYQFLIKTVDGFGWEEIDAVRSVFKHGDAESVVKIDLSGFKLVSFAKYKLVIDGVKDKDGNAMSAPVELEFQVGKKICGQEAWLLLLQQEY